MSHVNAGDGFKLYLGGKKLFERDRGVGKREGAQPLAYYLEKAWWPEFAKDQTTLAAMSFLRIDQNSTNRHFSVWLQEMKVPPMGREVILNSAMKTPMRSAEWQSLQDAMRNTGEDDGKYRWNGKFVDNPKLQGNWTALGQVQSMDEFVPGDPMKQNSEARLQKITFNPDGNTGDGLIIWTDNMLLDLIKNEAMKITPKTIDGADYLFIEAGGFHTKNGPDWTPPYVVLKRS